MHIILIRLQCIYNFIVPCYYIIYFGCFICINMLIYIIFGTNLLTQSPVPVPVFPLFQCFEEKEYQTESKRNETFGSDHFGTEAIQETWSRHRGSNEEATRQGGAPYPPGRAPYLVAASETPLTCSRRQNLLYIQNPPKHNLDREFRRR